MKYAFKRERYQKVTCTQLHEPNYDLSQYSVCIIMILIRSITIIEYFTAWVPIKNVSNYIIYDLPIPVQ